MPVHVIAEAGVNHNGEESLALDLVAAAAAAGADTVKFQTFRAEDVVTPDATKAAYQKATTDAGETQYQMLKRLELTADAHRAVQASCRDHGIAFLSSPFGLESLRFLVDDLGVDAIKIPSGEITNGPLLLAAARSGRRLIVSTGMSSLDEVRQALGVVAFGRTAGTDATPSRRTFAEALDSAAGRAALTDSVVLLHCTSQYPAPAEDVNLRAMDTLADTFGLPVGLSDHSEGIAVPIAAVARGATVIEKHLTLDRQLPGPDHRASLEPDTFAAMVAAIRTVERALGDGVKAPRPSEADTAAVARRSLAAIAPVAAGEPFTVFNLGSLRPGTGISPMAYWDWLGRSAGRDWPAGALLET